MKKQWFIGIQYSLQLYPQDSVQRKQPDWLISHSFFEIGSSAYFENCCLRVRLLNCTKLASGCDIPWGQENPRTSSLPSPSSTLQVAGISLEGSLHRSVPSFCRCCPRDRSPEHLPLIASGASIYKCHRTTTIKEAVLNRGIFPFLIAIHQSPAQRE